MVKDQKYSPNGPALWDIQLTVLPIVGKVPSRINGRKLESGRGAEWVGAGFCGHGMAYCSLTGKALAEMVLKGEENIGDWFPREEFACSEERLQRISLEDAIAFSPGDCFVKM